MSDLDIAELTLLDLSYAQRMAFAERWPRILLAAGKPELAEEIRAELSASDEPIRRVAA